MAKITIRYAGNSLDKDFASTPTFGDIIRDTNLKAVLGFGNVEAHVDGQVQPDHGYATDGDVVTLVNKANGKA